MVRYRWQQGRHVGDWAIRFYRSLADKGELNDYILERVKAGKFELPTRREVMAGSKYADETLEPVLKWLVEEFGVGETYEAEKRHTGRYAAVRDLYELGDWKFAYSAFSDRLRELEARGVIAVEKPDLRSTKAVTVLRGSLNGGQKPKVKKPKKVPAKKPRASKSGSFWDRSDLTQKQKILEAVRRKGGKLEVSSGIYEPLAEKLGTTKGTVSAVMSELEKSGIAKRLLHPTETAGAGFPLATGIELTPKGREQMGVSPQGEDHPEVDLVAKQPTTDTRPTPEPKTSPPVPAEDEGEGAGLEFLLERVGGLQDMILSWASVLVSDLVERAVAVAEAEAENKGVDPQEIKALDAKLDEYEGRVHNLRMNIKSKEEELSQYRTKDKLASERIKELEAEVEEVRGQLVNAERSLESFRKEFEGSGLGSRIRENLDNGTLGKLDKLMRELPSSK